MQALQATADQRRPGHLAASSTICGQNAPGLPLQQANALARAPFNWLGATETTRLLQNVQAVQARTCWGKLLRGALHHKR